MDISFLAFVVQRISVQGRRFASATQKGHAEIIDRTGMVALEASASKVRVMVRGDAGELRADHRLRYVHAGNARDMMPLAALGYYPHCGNNVSAHT
ncbi:hypothetical protein [Mycobacterium persicum]|uniref:hypothetical protein n=1 Tax=Mycobacterium persicum TaxID=1487726 RepID=UPI000A0D18CD|nr:hypothetical protein [Mycobacterium persicum]ORB88490.1 hypothetical protein B1T49_03455 [Mycobacterium persicum]